MSNLFHDEAPKAAFSDCRRYRYTLWRVWGPDEPYVNFICLNPSTADDDKDDNTIYKCKKLANSWGYSRLCVTNLFAYRSTDRKIMLQQDDPVGPVNDTFIHRVAMGADLIIAAWSQDGGHRGRSQDVRKWIPKPMKILRMGKSEPWHPLYLPDSSVPIDWPTNNEVIK